MSTQTVARRVLLLAVSVFLVLASTTACGSSSSSKAAASGPVQTKTNLTIGVSAAIEVEALPQIAMLNDGRAHLFDAPHLVLFPALAVMLAVLSFNFIGDALRDYLDPRSRIEAGL